jgi:NAD(P)-dependent dehydrogenase (short-subunit alcohol dehydrogenase family)
LKNATGFTAELLLLDMSDFGSVSAFATAFQEKYDRLDILVCNAGVVLEEYVPTKDGWETTQVSFPIIVRSKD